jgi:exodeoxyribonuclease VII large subunit
MSRVYTVAQMNSYIKNMFRQDFVLSRVEVKGEISNCKYHPSGHIYFTLKDEGGSLAAVMFAGQAKGLSFRLENGMKVVVSGRIDVYERDGKYQLYASKIENDGLGELYKRFEELKKYFEEMGYFSPEYKRPIPKYARKIGIVTASTGAAVHDIMNISYRRNPYISLVLYPALVQGAAAAESIVKGIETLDDMGLDVLIVGRGGGSIEDLWAFNEAIVAEAIFNAKTPVISAVGHETDFTIADFVADLRAPTPSAAAELAVTEEAETEALIEAYMEKLNSVMESRLSMYRNSLDRLKLRLEFLNPKAMVDERRQRLIQIYDRMGAAVDSIFKGKRHRLELYASRLNGVSPLAKLGQGYSYTEFEDGRHLNDISEVKPKDRIQIYIKNGNMKAEVLEVYNGEIDKS